MPHQFIPSRSSRLEKTAPASPSIDGRLALEGNLISRWQPLLHIYAHATCLILWAGRDREVFRGVQEASFHAGLKGPCVQKPAARAATP